MAWARDRRVALMVIAGVLLLMFGWLAYPVPPRERRRPDQRGHRRPQPVAGRRQPGHRRGDLHVPRQHRLLRRGRPRWAGRLERPPVGAPASPTQAATLIVPAGGRRSRSTPSSRSGWRIARELHDVVAHHVSVIGIHAGAARRVIGRDPAGASQALGLIEGVLSGSGGTDARSPRSAARSRTPSIRRRRAVAPRTAPGARVGRSARARRRTRRPWSRRRGTGWSRSLTGITAAGLAPRGLCRSIGRRRRPGRTSAGTRRRESRVNVVVRVERDR